MSSGGINSAETGKAEEGERRRNRGGNGVAEMKKSQFCFENNEPTVEVVMVSPSLQLDLTGQCLGHHYRGMILGGG